MPLISRSSARAFVASAPLFILFCSGAALADPRADLDPAPLRVVETELTISRGHVRIDGRDIEAMTVNGGVPGPVLRWQVGDLARIHVTNTMDVPTSVHWHGLLLPNRQDGVPGLTTPGIEPGQTHTFEIPIRHAGTYWYHSHTALQEQRGVYGAIVIDPIAPPRAPIAFDRDVVLVLSDWTDRDPNQVMHLLKRGSEWMSIEKGTAQSLWGAIRAGELGSVFRRALSRMAPMDISDVSYDAFLINGERAHGTLGLPGERVRLRVVNASASTYFYLGLGGQPLRVIAADGIDVEAVALDRVLMAIAETYDFDLTIPAEGRVEFRATAQDGSGSASAWFGGGQDVPARDVPRPNLYAMRHAEHREPLGRTPEAPHDRHTSGMAPMTHSMDANERPPAPYPHLRSKRDVQHPLDSPHRTIRLSLTGNMDRYVWSFDGRTLSESDVIPVRRGEVLRIELENTTMMHHPLHLHGHFFRVLSGQSGTTSEGHAPSKHTVDVAPMTTTTIEFVANADGDWFFHCHVLYHMKAGMSRIFHYEGSSPDPDLAEERSLLFRDPWYAWTDASVLSHFTEGQISASNTRNELAVEWEIGWQDVEDAVDHEVSGLYRYHFNRFYRVFAGGSFEGERNVGVFGAEALLPLNLDARAWIDTRGHGRFMLENELSITPRLSLAGEVEYDTEQGFEGSAGARFRVFQYGSLAFEWHSEFGFGGGVELIY